MHKYIFEKVVLAMLIIGLILVIIAAIFKSYNKTEKNVDHTDRTLVEIDQVKTTCKVYYDKDTRVMYLVNFHGGITVMVNPDGSPRLYKEDSDE